MMMSLFLNSTYATYITGVFCDVSMECTMGVLACMGVHKTYESNW